MAVENELASQQVRSKTRIELCMGMVHWVALIVPVGKWNSKARWTRIDFTLPTVGCELSPGQLSLKTGRISSLPLASLIRKPSNRP